VVRNVFDHPVCASKVASQHFVDAQPPLLWRRGMAAVLRFHRLATAALSRVFVQTPTAAYVFSGLPRIGDQMV